MIHTEQHPLLDAVGLVTTFPATLGDWSTPGSLLALLSIEARAPLSSDDDVCRCVRDLLRHGGYRPSGRGKPSSEYLRKAVADGRLGSINVAVDVCNVVSLHSGIPISVIDLDLADEPLSISMANPEDQYVFNASGQTIDLGGLLCLCDRNGPCANAVKDSQRTKTGNTTRRTLSIIWSSTALPGRAAATADWYRTLLEKTGAAVELAAIGPVNR